MAKDSMKRGSSRRYTVVVQSGVRSAGDRVAQCQREWAPEPFALDLHHLVLFSAAAYPRLTIMVSILVMNSNFYFLCFEIRN